MRSPMPITPQRSASVQEFYLASSRDTGTLARFPVLIWIEHLSADYNVCEQDSSGGESGYAHSMSPVPNPMDPLPISSTFRYATSEWNQDKN